VSPVDSDGPLPWYARKPPWWLVFLIILFAAVVMLVIQAPNFRS
jgi:hypothetical protein